MNTAPDNHVEIIPLNRIPGAIPQLARWHTAEWRRLGVTTDVRARKKMLRAHLGKDPVPRTFVAFVDGDMAGSVSLVRYGFNRVDPSHWLANLYVGQPFRRCGVATALIRRVQDYARELELRKLYLFTTEQREFYRRRGWTWLRQGHLRRRAVDIMAIDVDQPPKGGDGNLAIKLIEPVAEKTTVSMSTDEIGG